MFASSHSVAANNADTLFNQAMNSKQLYEEAGRLLKTHDLPSAALTYFMANIRAEADFHCFPTDTPGRAYQLNELGNLDAIIGHRISKISTQDPEQFASLIASLESWNPRVSANYDPGWKTSSRCSDYSARISDAKSFILKPMQSLSRLLKIPNYLHAYKIYTDVFQNYDQPPPDNAYSAERIEAAAAASKDIINIEKAQGIYVLSGLIENENLESPLAFHILAGGHTQTKIEFPDHKTANSSTTTDSDFIQIADNEVEFANLWRAIYPNTTTAQIPKIDFTSKFVVAAFISPRDTTNSGMFINSIGYDSFFSNIMVYLRVQVSDQSCAKPEKIEYPFVVAVVNRPSKSITVGGYDIQNFPVEGCSLVYDIPAGKPN